MTDAERSGVGEAALEGWDPGLLSQVAELNVQLLELLRRQACSPNQQWGGAGASLQPLLSRLREPAMLALARCPYLLFDAGFARPDCWDGAVHEAVDLPASAWLAPALATDLVRRAVMLGWHLARANPYAARISLGMTPQCARLIARTRLRDLEMLVERRAATCRLRWEDRPAVWRQLLEAAIGGSLVQLESLQLRGLQLLAADYRAPR